MKRTTTALGLAMAFAVGGVMTIGPAIAQDAPKAKAKAGPKTKYAAKGNCVTKYGRGWAWSVDSAKFQAWEIVAQTTGNWPIMTDTFRNERYSCKPEGGQVRCDSRIDVCKS